MTLGDLIKYYRRKHDLSMDAFAKKSGLSKAYVSLLEKNKHPKTGKEITPSVDVIKKVADAIGMDFDDVFNTIDSTTKIVIGKASSKGLLKYLNEDIPKILDDAFEEFNKRENETNNIPKDAIPYTPEAMVNIPLVGSVNCGTPLFAEDNIEGYIPTPESDIQTGETYFWLRAKGDSMVNVGIHDGDLLLIRKQDDVDNGDIAVVAVNGDEATLKRVKKQENAIILQPENPNCETRIFIGEDMEKISIRGRLMQLRKEF